VTSCSIKVEGEAQSSRSRGGGACGAHRDGGKTAVATLILCEPGGASATGSDKRQVGQRDVA
jgi:hypothetical protein